MPPPSTCGQQPRPGAQPPSWVQDCVHIGPVGASASQPPERHVLLPTAGQVAPIGSGPRASAGGTQIGFTEPNARSHVYGGKNPKRWGQSAAVRHSAVQPCTLKQIPVSHDAEVLHGFSMSTQTRVAPAAAHAKPAGQSAALSHSRVQCPVPVIELPMQSPSSHDEAEPVEQTVPVSSWRQKPSAPQTCSEAQSRCAVQVMLQKRVPPVSATQRPLAQPLSPVQRSR